MLSTWASVALNTPVIVDMVMAFLHDDKRTLGLCTQVSQLWAHAAIPFLWDEVNAHEAAHALAGSTDPNRRQWCLRQIRLLDFSPPKARACRQTRASLRQFFFGLKLLKLSKLKMTSWNTSNEEAVIAQYINDRLIDLYLSYTTGGDAFLNHLQAQCPQLVSLAIGGGDQRKFTEHTFLKLLINTPTLQKLRLLDLMQYMCTERVFCHLAARPLLTDLEFHFTPFSFVKSAEKATNVPFQHLRQFKCRIEEEALTKLIPHLETLESVHLTTRGVKTPLFLSLVWTLRSISIQYTDYWTFESEELFAIAEGCPGLTELELSSLCETTSTSLVTDNDIAEFISMVPRLTAFIFRIGNKLSIKSWCSFGKGCRGLRKLAISNERMPLPLLRLANEKVRLFPELRKMQFSYLDVEVETTPEAFVALLRYHAPQLRVCNLLDASDMKCTFVDKCRMAWPGNCPINMTCLLFT